MRVLQVNLNHCEAAHDLLMQTVRELKVDLAIISEPYRHLDTQAWVGWILAPRPSSGLVAGVRSKAVPMVGRLVL